MIVVCYHLRNPTYEEGDAQQKHEPSERPFFPGSRVSKVSSTDASHQNVVLVMWIVLHAQSFHDGRVRVNYRDTEKNTCGSVEKKKRNNILTKKI